MIPIENTTRDYHINDLNTLGWELTICNSLYPEDSPCRGVLKENSSYGNLLYNYLSFFIPPGEVINIIEIGGGYGYLMKDFLKRNCNLKATMLDISPFLLQKQMETLEEFDVDYIEQDFMATGHEFLQSFDMIILNENLGDLPTICNLNSSIFSKHETELDPLSRRVKQLFLKYSLDIPEDETFNFNIGAVDSVERICSSRIKYIFLCEHSCEAIVTDELRQFVKISSSGIPEKITLKGHDEYTIKFSYLQKLADYYGYKTTRGQLIDIVEFEFTGRLRFILSSNSAKSDNHEIQRHFIEDLYKYEYLIISL